MAPEENESGKAAEETPRIHVVDRRHWATETDEEGDETPRKPSYVEELEGKLATAEQQALDIKTQYRDAKSEFEGARARLSREVAQEVERHKRSILIELLDVVDNLERALEAATGEDDGLRDGVAMVRDQFLAKLAGFGVTRLQSADAPFDPERHEAVSAVPVTDAQQDNRIVGVIKEGFLIGEEVLRPAQVAVGRAAEASAAQDN